MPDRLSLREILEIALSVEERAQELYASLEKKAQSEEMRQIWCSLREDESLHREFFLDIIEGAGEVSVDFGQDDYHNYLNAISCEYTATCSLMEQKKKTEFKSDIEAVEFGIYVAKESILAYSALRKGLNARNAAQLDKIIDEEQQHLVRLRAAREALKKGA